MLNLRLAYRWRRLLSRLLCTGRQDRVQGVAFLSRTELDDAPVADVFNQALQNSTSQTGALLFAGHLERFKGRHDADLLAFVANHADFARANTVICADKTFIDTKPPSILKGVGMRNYSISRQS